MSLGFLGLSVGEAGESTEEIKTKYISWSGFNTVITPPVTPLIGNVNKLISGIVGNVKENGFAIENGFLEEFNWFSPVNNTTQPVHIELWESADDVTYAKVGDVMTMPAGQLIVKMVTGLHLTIKRGFSYRFRIFTDVGGTGTMALWFSFIVDYGTAPPMPTKYVNIGRQLEMLSGFSPLWFQLNIVSFAVANTNLKAPMPFNATISKVTLNKLTLQTVGAINFFIFVNGLQVFTSGVVDAIEIETFSPNVAFNKGDDVVFAFSRTNTSLTLKYSIGVAYESIT